MPKQVLIINITRMGDLVQSGVLLDRLQREQPGVAVDVVVDRSFSAMASLLPSVRHVLAFDFQGLMDDARTRARDVVQLHGSISAWARPLAEAGYDRVINLTFNRRSAWLVSYVGTRDVRGVGTTSDGSLLVTNPWMAYFADLHRYRRYNRFNLVDLYALGGSGPGAAASLSLKVEPESREWARTQLRSAVQSSKFEFRSFPNTPATNQERRTSNPEPKVWIAVQVGASDVMKAWRPEYFGSAMAAIRRQASVGFVMIGTSAEAPVVGQALNVFRAALGNSGIQSAAICDAVGRTNLSQLLGLLGECRLLLTNDTGPMHMAVSIGTPVVDLSVGHVDFRETGPYGPGHWVVQPELECAPCGFDMVCSHHACKDRIQPEALAALCVHVIGEGSFHCGDHGVRLYESGFDDDGLTQYILRAGREEPIADWYGKFWRRFWYEEYTGLPSRIVRDDGMAPDFEQTAGCYEALVPLLTGLERRADALVKLVRRRPLPVAELKSTQQALQKENQTAVQTAYGSHAFWPIIVGLLRDLHSLEGSGLSEMARGQVQAYQRARRRMGQVARMIIRQEDGMTACAAGRP